MKNTHSDIERALYDVRKAFRLLYSYQCKIRDIVQYVGALVSKQCEYGYSQFSHARSATTKDPLEYWIWDWLSMYCYEFKYEDVVVNNNKIRMSIWLVSDSGFFDKEPVGVKPRGKARLNLENYGDASESVTKLVFVASKNSEVDDFTDFDLNKRKDADEYTRRMGNKILLAKSFDLICFINEIETKRSVQKFATFCRKNGIVDINVVKQQD